MCVLFRLYFPLQIDHKVQEQLFFPFADEVPSLVVQRILFLYLIAAITPWGERQLLKVMEYFLLYLLQFPLSVQQKRPCFAVLENRQAEKKVHKNHMYTV